MKTASWFTPLPDGHQRIGISRGTPRGQKAGFRIFRKLAPGPWFNSVGSAEYAQFYQAEVLASLDPHRVADELHALSDGRVPVLLCYERADGTSWCHRAMAAAWLAKALGSPVPEVGFENRDQDHHPLLPATLHLLGGSASR